MPSPTTTEGIYLPFVPAQMAGSLTMPVLEPRQRYARFSSGTCCFQSLMDCVSQACKDFGLTINWCEEDECPGTGSPQKHHRSLALTTANSMLSASSPNSAVGSTITDNLSLDAEIDMRIGKAASTLACLMARVWTSPKLSVKTKMAVYNACVRGNTSVT